MNKGLPGQATPRSLLRVVLWRALVLLALWWVLSGGGASSWPAGAAASALALAASLKLAPAATARFSPAGAIGFLGFFLFQSLKGGVQVGAMALRPRIDIRPAELELELRLPPGPGQLFLASALSLMPGTLALKIEGSRLRLHALDARRPIERDVRSAEVWVARMFHQELR